MFSSILKKESISESTSDSLFSSVLNSTSPSDNTARSIGFLRSRNILTSRDFSSNPASLREQRIPEESLESSSSVQLEDSQDILVLGRRKLHGCQGTFSEQYGIKLKKLRKSRYSEHVPSKILQLQVDSDVQPEIASVRSSFVSTERRERAVSCYTKIQNKASFVDHELISEESRPQSPPEILVSREEFEYEDKNPSSDSECFAYDSEKENENGRGDLPAGANRESEDLCKISQINEEEESKESENGYLRSEENDQVVFLENAEGPADLHSNRIDSDPMSRSRSVDLLAEINGKVFQYFDRQVLCHIPVLGFDSLCLTVKSLQPAFRFKKSWRVLCCKPKAGLRDEEERFLEKLVDFSSQHFEFSNEFHLKLLLGAYCKITNSNDWPSTSEEWLEMGFASHDLANELRENGPIGLLYIFFLSDRFSVVLQEMLSVCKYFSYEVFNVCKAFIVETISFVRTKGLHKVFKRDDNSVLITFTYCTGMLVQWFELMTHNKDFDKSFRKVNKRAQKNPQKFLDIASGHISK